VEYPFPINTADMRAISSLPGIGKKRASRIVLARPLKYMDDLERAIGEKEVTECLAGIISFE
jgi:DNA uptake protein ComE-like DNA-binding protein